MFLINFLNLPLGSANEVFEEFTRIPGATRRWNVLEQFLFIEVNRHNRVLLVAHADTYWGMSDLFSGE